MSNASDMVLKTESSRLLKDKLAKYGVMVGGLMVLCALLLIFFYLLYVVKPVFHSADIEQKTAISIPDGDYLAVNVEEHNEIAFTVSKAGNVNFYGIKEGETKGKLLEQLPSDAGNVVASAISAPHKNQYAFINDQAELSIIKPFFRVSYPNDRRQLTPVMNKPVMNYPLGDQPIEIGNDEATNVRQFAFSNEEASVGLLYQLENKRLFFTRLDGEENMFTEEVEYTPYTTELDMIKGDVKHLFVSPDLSRFFVLTNKQIFVFDARDAEELELLYQVQYQTKNAKLTAAVLLPGANSLMTAFDNGTIAQWFEINGDQGRQFIKSRSFTMEVEGSDKAAVKLYPEYYRRTFAAVTASGDVNLFHTTSEAELWQGKLNDMAPTHVAFSPRSNSIVTVANNKLSVFKVENEHPEVTWSGLWQEVWYEGYPEADYIWQSSSASDDFESKFSLVPISFGTIKAAAYAMLFAVPIGLAAAIYTAYFMAPSVRKVVKPTVEIMEALPTVILGFLAGLWLAPVIEEHLPGVILLLIMLPITIFFTAYAWFKLPKKVKSMVPAGWDSIILIPVVALVGYVSFALSPAVEQWLFDGNTRLYITNELGITFDQRNSLIVGIAMGFAVIPTIFSIAEDAVFSVPKSLSSGSLALGATQWQTLTKVVLLTASPGIFSAIMMGLGRAVGETMIVLMATGNTPIMDWSIFEGMRTLSANIAVEMPESEVGSSHYRILFLAAFVLFIFTFVFNTLAEFVRQRLREKYSSL
jgi:phosphate transport system permease protein